MWCWLLAVLLVVLAAGAAAAAVLLWPAKPGTVWQVECLDGCGWAGELTGPSWTEETAWILASGHCERTKHTATWTEKGR